jgi:chromate reductase
MAHNGDGTARAADAGFVPGILAMADCFEPNSENQAMIDIAVDQAAALGTDVTVLDLRDLELPPYYYDAAANELPQGARAFRQLLGAHDGFLIALPSHYGFCPPQLMNAIAWSVCPIFGAEALEAYSGKCASLMSATGKSVILDDLLTSLRLALTQLGVLVLPEALILSADKTTNGAGIHAREGTALKMQEQVSRFVETLRWAQARKES